MLSDHYYLLVKPFYLHKMHRYHHFSGEAAFGIDFCGTFRVRRSSEVRHDRGWSAAAAAAGNRH